MENNRMENDHQDTGRNGGGAAGSAGAFLSTEQEKPLDTADDRRGEGGGGGGGAAGSAGAFHGCRPS